jgi:hypothetical protein
MIILAFRGYGSFDKKSELLPEAAGGPLRVLQTACVDSPIASGHPIEAKK